MFQNYSLGSSSFNSFGGMATASGGAEAPRCTKKVMRKFLRPGERGEIEGAHRDAGRST